MTMRRSVLGLMMFVATAFASGCGDDDGGTDGGSVVDSGSVTDSGGATDSGSATDGGSATDAAMGPKRVFVSSAEWSGDLGGLAGADAKCQEVADAASLGGTWIAWLSSSEADAIDRLADVGPWHLVSGELVFADKAAIADPAVGPDTGIGRDETGSFLSPAVSDTAWTGTGADGAHYLGGLPTTNCLAWTATSGESGVAGGVGRSEADRWTTMVQTPCGGMHPLYCFEQ